MHSLFALIVSLIFATASLAQSAGDVLMSAKGEGGGLVPVWVTKSANKLIGWDGSGNLVPVTQATPTWGNIAGDLADQEDVQEALAAKLSINAAAGLYQPLNAQLSAIGALSTTSFGRGLLTTADAAAARTALGLGSLATQSGTLTDYLLSTTAAATYQPLSEQLTLFAGLANTAFGRGLLNVADAEALRAAAGVPEVATQEAAETGESNAALMTPLRTAQAIAALGGGGDVDVQEFTTDGDWTNPSPDTPRRVCVLLIGGGGGGASGRRGASASSAGGGGGCSSGLVRMEMLTTDLAETEAVVVGTGGAGGAAVTVNDTNWSPGGNGTGTSFKHWTAPGGRGALSNNAGTATTYAVVDRYIAISSVLGGAGATGIAIAPASPIVPGGTPASGSGGGGGNSTTPGTGARGVGHYSTEVGQILGGAGGSTAGEAGGNGVIGPSKAGTGGGGGAGGTASVPGGAGGHGVRGSGGGGGGGSVNGANSGAGGNGGNGYALIITY